MGYYVGDCIEKVLGVTDGKMSDAFPILFRKHPTAMPPEQDAVATHHNTLVASPSIGSVRPFVTGWRPLRARWLAISFSE